MAHPLIVTAIALDVAAATLVVLATIAAVRVLLQWRHGTDSPDRPRLERGRRIASLQGRFATLLFVAGSLATVVAIAEVLADAVPGAMCGTGVIEAMAGRGNRALLLRAAALAALAAWHLFDRLDRSSPESTLAEPTARAMLLAAAVVPIAVWDSIEALARLDTSTEIDCCEAAYGGVLAGDANSGLLAGLDDSSWILALGICAVVLLPAALWVALGRARTWAPRLLGLAGPLFAIVGGTALIRVFAAYHYEDAQHDCFWCLFRADYAYVGYPLLGALALTFLEGPAAWIASVLGTRVRDLHTAARRRVRRAGLGALIGALTFLALAVGPALAWRLRHGAWMG